MRKAALITTGLLFVAATAVTQADGGQTYTVTITNVTRGQVITPPVLVSHRAGFELFTPGQPARPELVKLAEDGVTDDLRAFLSAQSGTYDVIASSSGIPPGASQTLTIRTRLGFSHLTAVGMLATTNDGFFAIQGIRVPLFGVLEVNAHAYDAGSEANNESCAFIPGPPCGSRGVRDPGGAEGYVHIHAGIHGGADLVPATHDWRNPVAEIRIERIH